MFKKMLHKTLLRATLNFFGLCTNTHSCIHACAWELITAGVGICLVLFPCYCSSNFTDFSDRPVLLLVSFLLSEQLML